MKTIEEILHTSPKASDYLGKDYQIFRMAGDASSREYFRVLKPNKDTCLLMLLPEGSASLAEEYESGSLATKELPFIDVQRLLQSKGVRVPEIYVNDTENRIILLEDLGDNLLIDKKQKANLLYTEKALDTLSTIANPHPETWKDSIAFLRAFDEKLYMWEFQHYIEYGIEKILTYKDSDIPRIQNLFLEITKTYCGWETSITHRDYHSKNIITLSKNEVGIIDFQDALMGPIYYDLASLLKDAYVQKTRQEQETLAIYYKNKLDPKLKDAQISDDEFIYRFDLMSLHRALKAAGRFVYIDQVKGNPNYLKDVPQALSYVIETMSLHGKLSSLKQVLEPYCQKLIEEV